ncbi:dihydrolipoamide acetyltransferase family protein [Actinoallomurus bryophytorum]|uniref:Dihydrolipoamide acetyltransferase component of pyruvate dehydrogenase complex n=1 Tax=Actinoallomurus bryophytorum TaxID=1490222 RepID=A0A543CLU1_9ACTN|nr:dihydrolipoamide acetyltransferase family protein [Actinoallomurus bryophytorum]TQL97930.1 pyruvate dehydrogenase E2 component (dihydrolipoamide acetyltransferase) [Actinoallomurus bryophytorum]
MGELKQFKLPDVGEGLTEADIIKWHVRPGDVVEVNQTILEIETAKAVVELPCPFEGTVTELLVSEGTTVDVGVPIITVDVGGEAAAPPAGAKEDLVPTPPSEGAQEPGMVGSVAPKVDPAAPQQQKRVPVLVGYGVKPGSTTRRARKSSAASTPASSPAPAPVVRPVETAPNGGGRVAVLAKPPVRKLAKDLGVDLRSISGTGPQGSITRDDIHQAASAPAPTRLTAVRTTGEREERVPIRGVRKHTAAAMVQSAFTAPHVTEWLQVDVTSTMDAVKRLRDLPDFEGVKVSPLLLVAKAFLLAARRHPMINAIWDEAAQEIVVKHYVHLGIAAATDRGLIVPKIREAQDLSLPDLAGALADLAATARAGKSTPQDLSDGTMTITNVGVFGVDAGTPILTPGESAILAVGQIRDMPWVHEGEIKIRKVTTLALSFDHRVVDGELGSAVLRDVGAMLEDPMRMLAWS